MSAVSVHRLKERLVRDVEPMSGVTFGIDTDVEEREEPMSRIEGHASGEVGS